MFKDVPKGEYRLSASFTGFHTTWRNLEITGDPTVDLGQIFMRDKTMLDEIVVDAEKPAVIVNGDTLEFNAGSFATKPNAFVEDVEKNARHTG